MRQARILLLLLAMAVVVAVASIGMGYAWKSGTHQDQIVYMGNLGMAFTQVTCGDPPGTVDLGSEPPKDVGWTECLLVDSDNDGDNDVLEVNVYNAYPGYQVLINNVIITNLGTIPLFITGAELVPNPENDGKVVVGLEGIWTDKNIVCDLIDLGPYSLGKLWVYVKVEQPALQGHTYTFQININGEQWNQPCAPADMDGTIGFWKNWDRHNTYAEEEIESWLAAIDAASAWLGPTTTDGMEDLMTFGKGTPMEERFLGQYLATRLNVGATDPQRTDPNRPRDISSLDPTNYLGLPDNSNTTLAAIIVAIEAKYGTNPDDAEFNIMMKICDAFNNALL